MAQTATETGRHTFREGYLVNDGLLESGMIGKLKQSYPSEPIADLRNNTPHNKAIGVHYDQSFLRYGEPNSVTAWVPIGDISLQGGGLIYLEGSDTLGRTLEDAFNKKARECGMTEEECISVFKKKIMMSSGFLELGPIKFLQDNVGGRRLLTEYQAGDVVFHKPHMIHASTINKDPENRIRLGMDLRAGLTVMQRWSAPFDLMMGCKMVDQGCRFNF